MFNVYISTYLYGKGRQIQAAMKIGLYTGMRAGDEAMLGWKLECELWMKAGMGSGMEHGWKL